jgi:hypothetical protein
MLLKKRKDHFSSAYPSVKEVEPKIMGEGETRNEMVDYENSMWSKVFWLYFDVNIAEPKIAYLIYLLARDLFLYHCV